jgi:ProP effector
MNKRVLHPYTAYINSKQKTQCKLARLDALRWLAEKFPRAFNNQLEIQPLKIGIVLDVLRYSDEAQAEGFSKSKLREAIVVFTRRIDYLACLKAREMRIDLEGNLTTQVTEEEAMNAALKIKRRIEKSAKNARKNSEEKNTKTHTFKKSASPRTYAATPPKLLDKPMTPHQYPTYSVHLQSTEADKALVKKPSIIIKPSRTFDPEAVAKLKQKLGLAHKDANAD